MRLGCVSQGSLQGEPGTLLGSILEGFGSHFGAILDGFGSHFGDILGSKSENSESKPSLKGFTKSYRLQLNAKGYKLKDGK